MENIEKYNLLPCPFCGDEVHLGYNIDEVEDKVMWRIGCFTEDCLLNVEIQRYKYSTGESAVIAWNTREPLEESKEQSSVIEEEVLLPCPFCGGDAQYYEECDAIWCDDCSGGVEDCTISKEELFKAWNTRVSSQIETPKEETTVITTVVNTVGDITKSETIYTNTTKDLI